MQWLGVFIYFNWYSATGNSKFKIQNSKSRDKEKRKREAIDT